MPKPTPMGRQCPKCGAADPPRYAKGQCAPCTSEQGAAWRRANPERKKALDAAWRAANPERSAASKTAWEVANPDKVLASRAAWTKRNPGVAKARAAAWRKANPEWKKANDAAWQAANRDRVSANNAARYRVNSDKIKAQTAAWAKANRGRVAEIKAAWKRANPEQVALDSRRRRARLAGVRCEPYREVDIFTRDNWTCHLCDQPIDPGVSRLTSMGATIDHVIPISKGGDDTPENVRAAHYRCNLARNNHTVEWARARLIPAP